MFVIYQKHQYFNSSPAGHTSWFGETDGLLNDCIHGGVSRGATAQSILAGVFYKSKLNMYFTMHWVVLMVEICFGRFTHILYFLFDCYFEFVNVLVSVIILIIVFTCRRATAIEAL